MTQVVHFIGFRGEEYWSAVRIWGEPHMIHMGWDNRARREIGEDDLVIFANGHGEAPPRRFNYPDLIEAEP